MCNEQTVATASSHSPWASDGTWKMRNDDGPPSFTTSRTAAAAATRWARTSSRLGFCVDAATTGAFGAEEEDSDGKCTSASASAYKGA